MKKPKAEDFEYKGGYGSAEYNDALLCYQEAKMKSITINDAIRIIILILLALALYGMHEQSEIKSEMFTDKDMIAAGA